jgi:hypothetical protein
MSASTPQNKKLFNLIVTEFMLIMVFIFFFISILFWKDVEKYKKENEELTTILVYEREIGEHIIQTNNHLGNVLRKMGESVSSVQGLILNAQQMVKRAEKIDKKIGVLLEIEEDWETIVFVIEQARDNCQNSLGALRKRCGTGYPLCLGAGVFLADLVFNEEGIDVSIKHEIDGVPILFENRLYSKSEFASVAEGYYLYSQKKLPEECRFQVAFKDKTKLKETFKKQKFEIDERFYSKEIY